MAVDQTKYDALKAAFNAINAPDREPLADAVDFLNAYADVGVWDAATGAFSFVDVGRARLLAGELNRQRTTDAPRKEK